MRVWEIGANHGEENAAGKFLSEGIVNIVRSVEDAPDLYAMILDNRDE